jgi:peptide/nickel transport system substrate-binding protein
VDISAFPAWVREFYGHLNFNNVLKRSLFGFATLAVFLLLAACSSSTGKVTPSPSSKPVTPVTRTTPVPVRTADSTAAVTASPVHLDTLSPAHPTITIPASTDIPAPSPTPLRVLTVCLGHEPQTLFLYQAFSTSARSVLQAIYDGPLDVQNFDYVPVLLTKKPTQADGYVTLAPVEVQPGESFVDDGGNLTTLTQGVLYRPSGCSETACAQAYPGDGPVTLDQMVVQFQLLPGLLWSDSAPLTADDSVFSFEVASSLYPLAQPERVVRTASYRALDAQTVEWRGLPGLMDPSYAANLFSPLPRHVWGNLSKEELLQSDATTKMPLGWGPYVIEQWTEGDHITFHKNPAYFRASEGLPYFDNLVFRFVEDGQQMLDALLTGECDLADSSAMQDVDLARLLEAQKTGQLEVYFQPAAWEMALFGIASYEPSRPDLFGSTEIRQAIARCIDRSKMAETLWNGQSSVLDTYVPPFHPLNNPDVQHYEFDPEQASVQLESIGWKDTDGDPATPRRSLGVNGVPDGTPLEFTYLVSADAERPQAAQILADSLAQCGIRVHIEQQPAAEYLAAGPGGPVFGRAFEMAQLAFPITLEPSCEWFTSAEIPGPYPDYPQGWGGVNAAGYHNPDFDQACQTARTSLAEAAQYRQAHFQAQVIFAIDLPVIPLYLRLNVLAAQSSLCGLRLDASSVSALWNVETWTEGANCGR